VDHQIYKERPIRNFVNSTFMKNEVWWRRNPQSLNLWSHEVLKLWISAHHVTTWS
jgi:hypothetical protein